MKTLFKSIVFYLIINLWFISPICATQSKSDVDTLYWSLTLPELQSYRNYYIQELDKLEKQKEKYIDRGIADGERLLQAQPDVKMGDDILIRLAYLYYYKEKDQYLQRMKIYDEFLEKYNANQIQEIPNEPKLEFEKAFSIYQRIIDEFPSSEMVDDAAYNMGFLYEEMGLYDKANQAYQHLIEFYPTSPYIPEANVRMGEYYFNPPINNLDKAVHYYKNVLKYKQSPRYREALYKIGWSYYRLSQYPEAISYFTMLVEDIKTTKRIGQKELSKSADLYEEAIQYIAICFLDFGGSRTIQEYLQKIGNPSWGKEVLEKLGDIYKEEKEEYQNAIIVYQILLNLLKYSGRAPVIQNKIVECYRAMGDEKNAFLSRQRLFDDYQLEGSWWNQINDEKAKYEAYRLTEVAMRENINFIIRQAEAFQDHLLFKKAVEAGKRYLEKFPEDLNAYMIRWNVALILDTKLHQYQEALEEYLTISMAYNTDEYEKFARSQGLSSIQDAAENAIVVADTLVQLEKKGVSESVKKERYHYDEPLLPIEAREPIPLSPAEKWLATAYENYLRIFPFDQKTPVILANAGALYYTYNHFNEALKYFKTLIKYFPNSEQVQNVQYSILESYFGKKDFQSVEILAKRILAGDYPDDMKKKVEKRLGEAIFLKAQSLAEAGNSKKAATEYYRMVLAAPKIEFADRALYNAAQEYERVQDYNMAIRAYETLRTTYSSSSLLKDALNNLALNYGEIGDFQQAGERYEELAVLYKGVEEERNALYNSFIFYVKANNWRKAIKLGEQYIDRYPYTNDSPEIYYKIGEYSKKVNDFEKMIKIYNNFNNLYPNSSLCVEAHFEMGKYHQANGDLESAEHIFYQAFLKNDTLKQQGIDHNDYIASESLFLSTKLLNQQYRDIIFRLPPDYLNQSIEKKQELLSILIERYTQVISFQSPRLPESLYRIGEIYENYAGTWADQELPVMNPTEDAIKQKEINGRTTQIYRQALGSFRKGIETLDRLIKEKDQHSLRAEPLVITTSDTLDSLTRFWHGKIKEKVSETIYRMAQINTESVDNLLKVPIPKDLSDIEKLEYRSQVLLKAVKPLVNVVVNAHYKNLLVADSLGLINQWIEASKEKIIEALYLIDLKYLELTFDTIGKYRNYYQEFCYIAWNSDESIEMNRVNTLVNLVEMARSYSRATVVFRGEAFERLKEMGFKETFSKKGREQLVESVLIIADSLKQMISSGLEEQRKAEEIFNETEDNRYEEILTAFEDNVYFLEENLKNILEETYRIDSFFNEKTQSRFLLEVELIKLDPETYADRLGIAVETMQIPTDTTWLYTTEYQPSWKNVSFIGGEWISAQLDSLDMNEKQESYGFRITGNLLKPENKSFYIRKVITIPGIPLQGEIKLDKDLDIVVFMNGIQTRNQTPNETVNLTPHLQDGNNVIGLELLNRDSFSIKGLILITFIPEKVYANLGKVK